MIRLTSRARNVSPPEQSSFSASSLQRTDANAEHVLLICYGPGYARGPSQSHEPCAALPAADTKENREIQFDWEFVIVLLRQGSQDAEDTIHDVP